MSGVHFVLGGARSGKSHHAETLVQAEPGPWTYIATAQGFDEEMRIRIAAHRARRSEEWVTLDAPLNLALALDEARQAPVLVDCLTLWLTNLLLCDYDVPDATDCLIDVLSTRQATTVLVSNEVGQGIVPDNALARRFRDEAGILHQRMASIADSVVFMVAGLPMRLK
jgi:adenosylcobinamide kinase/adenosylcobinamide-phosphate guanylyltransferase